MEIAQLIEVWLRKAPRSVGWPEQGLAIEGDFAGIQKFILKPVPGAKGAAKRLRGRSLRVVALADLIATEIVGRFNSAEIFYQAGGRILLHAAGVDDWEARLSALQTRLDEFFLTEFNGETVFHLAAHPFSDGRIPVAGLLRKMTLRRKAPLARILVKEGRWNSSEFHQPAPEADAFRCPACLSTASGGIPQRDDNDQVICRACVADQELGAQLASVKVPCLEPAQNGSLQFLDGRRYRIASTGRTLDVIHRLPRDRQGNPLSLTEIAGLAIGARKYLGYLRLDADDIGAKFRVLDGDPGLTLTLSEILQKFFSGEVQKQLEHPDCKHIYPVYGGGDDVFVIGPWNEAIEFARWLGQRLKELTADNITFSAGLALAKPGQHILTKADEAEHALSYYAKRQKPALHALGTTVPWNVLPHVLQTAAKLAGHVNRGSIAVSLLQDMIGLHNRWLREPDSVRHKALLHYQVQRNLKGRPDELMEIRDWITRLITGEWPWVGFLARYALLARKDAEGKRKEGGPNA